MGRGERRVSPALAVALLALVVAIAGSAIADPVAKQSAIGAKKAKKIARKQVNNRFNGITVRHGEALVPPNSNASVTAVCPSGTVPLGGGGSSRPLGLEASQPSIGSSGQPIPSGQKFDTWYVQASNAGPRGVTAHAYIICG